MAIIIDDVQMPIQCKKDKDRRKETYSGKKKRFMENTTHNYEHVWLCDLRGSTSPRQHTPYHAARGRLQLKIHNELKDPKSDPKVTVYADLVYLDMDKIIQMPTQYIQTKNHAARTLRKKVQQNNQRGQGEGRARDMMYKAVQHTGPAVQQHVGQAGTGDVDGDRLCELYAAPRSKGQGSEDPSVADAARSPSPLGGHRTRHPESVSQYRGQATNQVALKTCLTMVLGQCESATHIVRWHGYLPIGTIS